MNEKRTCITTLRWILTCPGGCKVKKDKWARHVKTEKHRKEVEGEAVMEKLVVTWWGERVGRTEHHTTAIFCIDIGRNTIESGVSSKSNEHTLQT